MTQKTKDGYKVTTVEQNGPNAGEEIGRVFLLRENGSDYWGVGSAKTAENICNKAPQMTRAEFEEMMENR